MLQQLSPWIAFNLFVLLMLVIDLGIFHRKSHEIKFKEALTWSAICVFLALLFNVGIYFWRGKEDALVFLTGYLLEQSLSVDNLFVFLLIFSYFRVPAQHQHTVLFWGILGALVMRLIFILAGVVLITRFHWIIYLFGAFLVITGIRLAFEKDKEIHPENNPILKLFRRFIPVTKNYEDKKFFVRREGRLWATPLFVVLLVVETTDVLFAVDSIPAILAITQDPFIIYTSNVFAILCLRSMYFVLAKVMDLFHHLHYGLAFILVFVGVKMIGSDYFHIPIPISLTLVAGALILSVLASLLWPSKKTTK